MIQKNIKKQNDKKVYNTLWQSLLKSKKQNEKKKSISCIIKKVK